MNVLRFYQAFWSLKNLRPAADCGVCHRHLPLVRFCSILFHFFFIFYLFSWLKLIMNGKLCNFRVMQEQIFNVNLNCSSFRLLLAFYDAQSPYFYFVYFNHCQDIYQLLSILLRVLSVRVHIFTPGRVSLIRSRIDPLTVTRVSVKKT